jgi:hypothetical protein
MRYTDARGNRNIDRRDILVLRRISLARGAETIGGIFQIPPIVSYFLKMGNI